MSGSSSGATSKGVINSWNDAWATDLHVPIGASAPDRVLPPGITGIDAYGFDGNATTESLSMVVELPHDFQEGTDVFPHLHWCGSSGAAGNVKWNMQYAICRFDEEMGAVVSTSFTAANPGLGANGRAVVRAGEFPAISGLKVNDLLRIRIFRNPGDAADTYGADAIYLQFGIHYVADQIGSAQKFSKA